MKNMERNCVYLNNWIYYYYFKMKKSKCANTTKNITKQVGKCCYFRGLLATNHKLTALINLDCDGSNLGQGG